MLLSRRSIGQRAVGVRTGRGEDVRLFRFDCSKLPLYPRRFRAENVLNHKPENTTETRLLRAVVSFAPCTLILGA